MFTLLVVWGITSVVLPHNFDFAPCGLLRESDTSSFVIICI